MMRLQTRQPISSLNFIILAPFWPFSGLHFDYLGPAVLVEQGLPISPLQPLRIPLLALLSF